MRPQEMVAKLKRTVESLNEVKDGFGDAWLLNNMKKTNPAIIDKMDQQEMSTTPADSAV